MRAIIGPRRLSPRAVLLDFPAVGLGRHLATADRADEKPVEHVHVAVVVRLHVRLARTDKGLSRRPCGVVDYRIMLAVVHLVAVALDHVRLSARALYRLGTPAAIGNLSDVHRVGNHALYRSAGERVHTCVTAWLLLDSMVVQPCGYRHRPFVLVRVHLEDATHDLRLVLIDLKFFELVALIDKAIPEGRLPSVPVAFAGLLLASAHGLGADVVALHLGEHGGDGQHRLTHGRARVDAVLHATQLHAVVLERLKGVPSVGSVAPEA